MRYPQMRNLCAVLFAVVIVFAGELVAQAQFNTNDDTGTNAAGNVSGQTGQSERFSIQRDPNAFIGGSATNIVGGQAATGAGGVGGAGTAGLLGALGSVTGRGNMGLGNQFNQANNQTATEPQIRFRMTLGFSHPRPAATKIRATFVRRLSRIPQLPSARSVAVTMEDRTAVLAGQVDSEREKRLIEKLAMMEPGVAAVRNELTVNASEELPPLPESTN